MTRPGLLERMQHPEWCVNLIVAGRVRAGERVLVVVDEPLVAAGAQLTAAIADAGGAATLELWTGARPLTYPPPPVLIAARRAHLMIALFQEPRPDEATGRAKTVDAVTMHGGRALALGFVDTALLENELSQPPPELEAAASALLDELTAARRLRVQGAAGTDLRLLVTGRPWLTDARPLEAGAYANYPPGEVFVAPHADGAEGVLVVDLTIPYTVTGFVDEPVTLRFKNGLVTAIEGGRAAELLRTIVDGASGGAKVIGELGIGLNGTVTPRGHVMLDEKAAGTAHVALGHNRGLGGDNDASIHVDCVFSAPTLEVDGRPIQLP